MRSTPSHARTNTTILRWLALAMSLLASTILGVTCASKHEPVGEQTFTSPQSHPIVLSSDGSLLFVANTTSRTVSVVDTSDNSLVRDVEVGLEPVGLALRPDGSELWVSNHVSDSVSVVDLDPLSDTYLRVVATVQEFDANARTLFDEPVGIAFANNDKAYVALSSTNQVAVVDANTKAVTGHIAITAQEPRSLVVRGGYLFVVAFESGNQSELSICPNGGSPPQCTLDTNDLAAFVATSPNIPGSDARIVRDPDVPDRDLFVIDTSSDTIVDSVTHVGTLLYDLAVSSGDEVFITQTEARNDINPQDGDNLITLDNRMFLNQIATVSCPAGSCGSPSVIDLEPLPPSQPAAGDQLATPYGIAISGDDTTLVATAAGTSRLFTMDASTGTILDILDLNAGVSAAFGQQIPKGVALRSDGQGAPQTAYVLNTLENTVSVVDVSNPSALVGVAKFGVGSDPTPDAVRRGRIAFSNAFASTSGTFSCESCHPDGNTDQLLWRIGGACFFGDCSGNDEIRSTMPVRGLRNTVPLHWDGSLGDPFGGINGAYGSGNNRPPTCTLGPNGDEHDCFLDLVGASLAGVMCDQNGSCPTGGNELSAQEQDDMATFLANVSYPPARSRANDDTLTNLARQGFADFFIDQGGLGNFVGVRTCADMDSGCHALPLGADNSSSTLAGFDAPTMRGMTDRWIQFSIGITAAEETLEWVKSPQTFTIPGLGFPINAPATLVPFDPAQGMDEKVTFAAAFTIFNPVYGRGPNPMFQMFEQASTGFSGATGRQVTFDQTTTDAGNLAGSEAILADLETADARGFVNLRGVGVRDGGGGSAGIILSYRSGSDDYRNRDDTVILTRAQIISEAQAGTLDLTFTATLPENFGKNAYRQPLLSVTDLGDGTLGNPNLPVLTSSNLVSNWRGIDVRQDAQIVVDGAVVGGTLSCVGGSFGPYCDSQEVQIALASAPAQGLHVLQLQNPHGPLSEEIPLCVADSQALTLCQDP